jgi:hypothetical protein
MSCTASVARLRLGSMCLRFGRIAGEHCRRKPSILNILQTPRLDRALHLRHRICSNEGQYWLEEGN